MDEGDSLRRRLTKPGRLDPAETGITFVDVLFALVVAEGFAPLRRWEQFVPNGRWHVGVAVVLTLASWIGYHTSKNRPRYEIRFFNWPLAQFVLDIGMVIVYWIAITTYEKSLHATQSAWPEALLVLVAFVLYSLWDLLGWQMKKSGQYSGMVAKAGDWRRRAVSLIALAVAGFIALLAGLAQHNRWWPGWVYRLDLALILFLVLYRAAKEAVTPVEPTA